ncbi:peptidyl-prolyl cis-trans isomerase [PVC group bacterium]|nr:peptidyl-prolyl cis-trans isomerase [PVC group bacterium]
MSIVFLREHLKKIIATMAVLIIPGFVLWGAQDYFTSKRHQTYAAKIYDTKIKLSDYTYARQTIQINSFMDLLGMGLNFDQARQLLNVNKDAFDEMAWDRLVFLEKAKQKGTLATDTEVANIIFQNPFFTDPTTRQFNKQQYQAVLSRGIGVSVSTYEEIVRDNVRVAKNTFWTKDFSLTTSNERNLQNHIQNDAVTAIFIPYKSKNFTHHITNTKEEIRSYYSQNQDQFLLPPQTQIQYVELSAENVREGILVTDEEIDNYYEENKEAYFEDEKISARHILISHKDAERATNQSRSKEEAYEIVTRLLAEVTQTPERFSEVAKKESDGPSNIKGGDLGEFSKGAMDINFEEAAFRLTQNEISDIVETPYGFHIIQVYARQESVIQTLDDVRKDIKENLEKNRIEEALRQKAYVFSDELYDLYEDHAEELVPTADTELIKNLASVWERPLHTSPWFSEVDTIDEKWYFPELIEEALSLEVGEPGSLAYENQESFYVFQVTQKREAYLPSFDEVYLDVDKLLLNSKAFKAAKAKAIQDRQLINTILQESDQTIETALKNLKLPSVGPKSIFYGGTIREFQDETELAPFAFSVGQEAISPPLKISDGFVLVYVTKRSFAEDLDSNPEAKTKIQNQLRLKKAAMLFEDWKAHLRRNVVEINWNM